MYTPSFRAELMKSRVTAGITDSSGNIDITEPHFLNFESEHCSTSLEIDGKNK